MNIEQRLREVADKWEFANREVYQVCRDAAEEIRVLNTRLELTQAKTDSIIDAYKYGSGWGKGKDE